MNKIKTIKLSDKLTVLLGEKSDLLETQKSTAIKKKVEEVLPCGSLWINGSFYVYVQLDGSLTEEEMYSKLTSELDKYRIDLSCFLQMFSV